MADWSPLRDILREVAQRRTFSWDELDALVGGLPPSAYEYPAFWSGDRSMWQGVSATEVRVGRSVTFVRRQSTPELTDQQQPAEGLPDQPSVPRADGTRTIWELLEEAVAELPEPFSRQDVLEWFAAHHPDTVPASISAHLQFATSNAPIPSRGAFAHRISLVTGVGRGEYVRYQGSPDDPGDDIARDFDIVLVGCARAQRLSPTRAADLYVSPGFRRRRAIAEAAGASWYVLSAEHGLVAPDEWLAPYDLALAETPVDYRTAWGRWAVARLVHKEGDLRGRRILVLAPAPYADPLRPALLAAGAELEEPLTGLRQGEQGAWLVGEMARRKLSPTAAGQGPAPTPTSPLRAHHLPTVREIARQQEAVIEALLDYRGSGPDLLHASRLGFATEEADQLLQSDPFAFLLGVLLDDGAGTQRAWQGPLVLQQRLGHLDPWRLRNQPDEIRAAVAGPPAIHRDVDSMADAIVMAAARVCTHYDGDAARIWAPDATAAEVDARLRAFGGIGPQQAAGAIELLMSNFGVELADPAASNVAYDVHVRRVLLRTGLVEVDDINAITAAARRLYPPRPGSIDLPVWLVGRRYCHSAQPDCPACPLTSACPKLTGRNV